jgi:hypothetical protein
MQEPALFVRAGDHIVPAPAEDIELARSYAQFAEKGPVHNGYRLTILTQRTMYRVGEEVRVIHICEAVAQGTQLYVMGPKPPHGECIDDIPAVDPPPNPADPLAPSGPYDGRVIPGPGVDANYEITRYRFSTPGIHTISWRPGAFVSNVRVLEISA